ncbi:MAG: competence/damage-inducible protein A [Alphaproteobacteria bacterium]|nr:MAG: competence/damage-inducible protein A [Alphaproteobacteria bacterium]
MTDNAATDERVYRACLIIIGDEILSGRTRDRNLAYIAEWLNDEGIELKEARVIPDDRDVIVRTVNECRAAFEYVFTTGGIGPTHDDITAESIASAFGVALEYNAEAHAALAARVGEDNMTEGRRRMTRVPAGGEIIRNPVSAAPGFRLDNVYVLAGIPDVVEAMLGSLKGKLAGGRKMLSRSMHAYAGESVIAHIVDAVQAAHANVSIGSYPFYYRDRYGANLVLRARDRDLLAAVYEELRRKLVSEGIEVGDGDAPEPDPIAPDHATLGAKTS